ncbi:MAG: type II toxin-antitoxin system VapC family toxin [Caldilineaceae bacterium]
MLVLDCSILMAWVAPDEASDYAEQVREVMMRHNVPVIVPPLFYLEIVNVLEVMQRRKRMDASQLDRAVQLLGRLPVTVDSEGMQLSTVLAVREIMREHALTAYDAAYLELGLRRKLRLSTLDKALQKAAEAEKLFFATK